MPKRDEHARSSKKNQSQDRPRNHSEARGGTGTTLVTGLVAEAEKLPVNRRHILTAHEPAYNAWDRMKAGLQNAGYGGLRMPTDYLMTSSRAKDTKS
eukprot:4130370-Amphidinium_carterae.3